MNNIHDTVIYAIVGLIICVQLFFFLKNFKKIMAYKNIIISNEKLSIVELNIEEDNVSLLDPDYFLKNKELYASNKDIELEDTLEEIGDTEISDEYDYDDALNMEDEDNLFS